MDKITAHNKIRQNESEQMTSLIGMVILLGSLAMFFITIMASYGILRVRSSNWGMIRMGNLAILLSWFNLIVLMGSSYVFSKISKIAKETTLTASIRWVDSTIICGVIFLGLQIFIWSILSSNGYLMTSHQAGYFLYGLWITWNSFVYWYFSVAMV